MGAPSIEAMKLLIDPNCDERIREALEEGRSPLEASKILGVSETLVRNRIKAKPELLVGINLRGRGRPAKYA